VEILGSLGGTVSMIKLTLDAALTFHATSLEVTKTIFNQSKRAKRVTS
jgi:hypothetical protein